MRLAVHLAIVVAVASSAGRLHADAPASKPARRVVYRSAFEAERPADAAWADAKVIWLAVDGKARPVLIPARRAITLRLTDLPDHDTLILTADVYFLGTWDEPARNQPPGTDLRMLGGMLRLGGMAEGPWLGIAPLRGRLVAGEPLFVSPLTSTGADIGPLKTANAGPDGDVPVKIGSMTLAWRHLGSSMELRIDMARDPHGMSGPGPLGTWWAMGNLRVVAATVGETGEPLPSDRAGEQADTLARMICQPKQTIANARRLLVPEVDKAEIDRLVGELSAPSWATREAAYRKLAEIAPTAATLLQSKLDDEDLPTETHTRLKQLLAESKDPQMTGSLRADVLRHLLAMRLINTPGARDVLADAASSSPWPEARSLAEGRLKMAHRARVTAGLVRAEDLSERGEVDKVNALLAELREGTPKRFHVSHDRIDRAERALSHSGRFRKLARDLRARLEARPDDAAARARLIYITIVDLDQPERAAKLDHESLDPFLRSGLKLFAVDPANLNVNQAHTLAYRYRDLAIGASRTGQLAMLSRSRDLLARLTETAEQALDGPQGSPLDAYVAKAYLADLHAVESRIRELTHPLRGYENLLWTNVLGSPQRRNGLWRVEQDKVPGRDKGSYTITDQRLILKGGPFSRVFLPVEPMGDYDLLVRFTRTAGKDGIFIHLPVSGPPRQASDETTVSCNLNLSGWEGAVDGLEWIDRQEANSNPTTRKPSKIRTGQTHELIASVRTGQDDTVRVRVMLDGQPYISWQGKRSQLQAASAWEVGKWKSCIGVGAHQSDVTFHQIGVKMVTGMAIEDKTGD